MSTDTADTRHQGQVKFFNIQKGFGFVRDLSNNAEYFVHATDLRPKSNCFSALYNGEYVEFTLEKYDKGVQCKNVTGILNGTLLCEHNYHLARRKRKVPNGKRQKSDEDEEMTKPE